MTTASTTTADPRQTVANRPPRRWRRRLGRGVVLYVIVPYVAVVVIIAGLQRRLLYPRTQVERLRAADVDRSSRTVTDVELQTDNGVRVRGWHFHAEPSADGDPRVILYFPGNSGCRADRVSDCRELASLGCDVLIFDYRGYGDSDGSPSEEALAADARLAWRFATDELHAPAERIVLFGESLGGAVAVRLAAEQSRTGAPPAGLVLNSTFASLPETVGWHYPAFPFRFLLIDRYPSAERMGDVNCGLLQFHGTDDEFVPIAHGRELFAAAPPQSRSGVPKRFVEIPGGMRNAIPAGEIRADVARFLDEIREATVHQTEAH